MNSSLIIEVLSLILLFALSAFFSSSETAFFSINPVHLHRIRRKRPDRADLIQNLLSNHKGLLSTLLIGNTIVNVGASALGFSLAERCFPNHGELVAIPAMTIMILLFGEVAPKRLAMARSDSFATACAPVLAKLMWTTAPLRFLLEKITSRYQHHFSASARHLTEDEFLTVVEVGEEEGVLDEDERSMVDGIISLEEGQASEIMTPRVDVVGIDLDDGRSKHEETASKAMYRYIPVYKGSLDNPKGFLDVFTFLLSQDRSIEAATIPPYFVPETMPLDNLLSTFQKENRRIAFVVDEYGGTAGIVTRGDILEEIIPDVAGEYREDRLTIQNTGPNRWLVKGDVSLDDINYDLDLNLDADGVDRISGWFIEKHESLPKPGDKVESQGCRATVRKVRRNRITLLELEKTGGEG